MKTKDIVNMTADELRKLTTPEMRKIAQQLADASNKRLKRLTQDKVGRESPAIGRIAKQVRKVEKVKKNVPDYELIYRPGSAGKQPFFTIKDIKKGEKTERAKIKASIESMQLFYQNKTASLTQWKPIVKHIEEKAGGKMTKKKWKAFRQVLKDNSEMALSKKAREIYNSDSLLTMVAREKVKNRKKDGWTDISSKITKEIKDFETDIEKAIANESNAFFATSKK